ncbi:MAG TPA: PQQ-binding-like beta-propeller repeat protein [Cyclobacteriaceae bacterium]|nr:PQQ-binding-like beta-propeller repeat protein [Cyclobacteriaceae bacterium]
MMRWRPDIPVILIGIVICASCKRNEDRNKDWPVYKGDAASTSYSPLDLINKHNVGQLQIAWTFEPDDVKDGSMFGKYECNPIVIGDVMYLTSARHWLYAVNARNGQKLWSFDPFDGERGGGMYRGVTYWHEGVDERILFTAGNHLFAVDAKTGQPIQSFGNKGKVNLGIVLNGDTLSGWVIPTSPGIIHEDKIILGSEVSELYGAAPGYIRAFNVKTGALEWTFHTIPLPGEMGYETWPADAWKYVGGANCWGGMTLDSVRGIVFAATGSPTYDYYGADRKGANLYGNCILALDARTGKLIWHFQTVHHDLWDYDIPSPPNLVAVEKDGKRIDAVAQTTKTGFLFVLNRETGESIFPIDERAVPKTNVQGEETWATQPFPVKPDPYVRQTITENDLTASSQEALDSIIKVFRSLRFEGMYTPPDPNGTLMIPGSRGGSEWGGAAYDPSTGIIYINANESPEIARVQRAKKETSIVKNQTVYDVGKGLYQIYCANCHGVDRGGLHNNPSLLGIDKRMTRQEVRNKIEVGAGRMPGFATVLNGQEDEIVAYLFGLQKNVQYRKRAVVSDTTATFQNITAYGYFNDAKGHPAIKPPWGTLNAINLNTGELVWKVPLGNYSEWQREGEPPTGTENYGGSIVTGGDLLFIGATRDKKFRAFDKQTGALVWETTLRGNGHASPSTYMIDGRQYIVISVTGTREEPSGHVVAFSLPE